MSEKLKALLADFGAYALVIYLVIFAATLLGFAAAIRAGFEVEGTGETAGLWFAAWLATKATQPLRIGATLVLAPLVAGLVRRFRPQREAAPEGAATEAASEPPTT